MPRRRNRACNAPTGIDRETRSCAIESARYSWPGRKRVSKHPTEEQDRIAPATVLPIPHPKPIIHGLTRSISLTRGGTGKRGSLAGLFENVSRVIDTTTRTAAAAAE